MESLQIIWFFLWALLWCVYFAVDGFVIGTGMIYSFVSKNEAQKKTYLSTIMPFWDGNEVWLITAGGVTFAAFPKAYALMFSWFYLPFFLLLVSLIMRGFLIEFREKYVNKKIVDLLIPISSFLIGFVTTIFFANLYKGVEVVDWKYYGSFWSLFTIKTIIFSILSISIFIFHSLLWLSVRVINDNDKKLYNLSNLFINIVMILFAIFILLLPFDKTSQLFWIMALLYVICFFILIFVKKLLKIGKIFSSFILSTIFIILFFMAGFCGIFPSLIPSKFMEYSLTIYNSSSSAYTLKLMLIVVIIFIPIVIAYQIWVYKNLAKKINLNDIEVY